MVPKFGGDPLPDAPDCLPREHAKARGYVVLLTEALGRTGWSAQQRRTIRSRYRKWVLCAEGRDAYFERYGSFPRAPGSPPPTTVDAIVRGWRRRILADLTPDEKREVLRRRKVPARFRRRDWKPSGEGLE